MASYSDNFDRPDSTNIGNWTEHADNWSIISNQLAPGLAATSFVTYNSPLDTSNHYAEIAIPVASATSMGVLARSDVGGNNFYLWRSDGSNWDLFYNVGGSFTSIASYAAPLVNGDVARIECNGSTIKGYVNGVERVSVVDTQIPTGTYVGVRSQASSTARYDSFLAADLASISADPGAFFPFIQ